MATPLRVLILEDREADAELMLYELRRAGFEPDWRRVESEVDYLAQLGPPPDVILADYTLPQWDALRALQLLQERSMDIPLIVVTGTISEEVAVECMKQGADDYLLKDRLARLGQAVESALEEKRLREEKRRAEEALRRSLEEVTHSQQLLLALSQVAQEVQRAHMPEKICRTVGEGIERLGHNVAIFTLTEDKTHLVIDYFSRKPEVVGAAEELIGTSAQEYRIPLSQGGYFQHFIDEGRTSFHTSFIGPIAEALPEAKRPLTERLVQLLGIERGIVVPLKIAEEIHGLLIVTGKGLSNADVSAVEIFANQTAIAMENAKLFGQVFSGRRRLRMLSHQLVMLQERERRFIARELHDEIGQTLTGLKLVLEISIRMPAKEARDKINEAQTMVNELLSKVRDLSLDLRPSMLDDLGLLPALLWHFERHTASTDVEILFRHSGLDGQRFSPEIETTAYRIVQEALTNIVRHAGVKEATVRIWVEQDTLNMQVEDTGTGFDHESTFAASNTSGLIGMYERAALVGGDLTVISAPGEGTRLLAKLPLRQRLERRKKERRA